MNTWADQGAVVMSGGLTVPKESVTFIAEALQRAGISALN